MKKIFKKIKNSQNKNKNNFVANLYESKAPVKQSDTIGDITSNFNNNFVYKSGIFSLPR